MTHKMGRPTDDPKTLTVKFRISEVDKERLAYCSEKTGRSQAEIIRQGIKVVYEDLKKEE